MNTNENFWVEEGRTDAYICTVANNPAGLAVLGQIRLDQKEINRDHPSGEKRYVTVRGRLGKSGEHTDYYRGGWPRDVRPEHAERFDIYLHRRY